MIRLLLLGLRRVFIIIKRKSLFKVKNLNFVLQPSFKIIPVNFPEILKY